MDAVRLMCRGVTCIRSKEDVITNWSSFSEQHRRFFCARQKPLVRIHGTRSSVDD
jgi:predicted Fe-S protein YdhL (DUF1289 family)